MKRLFNLFKKKKYTIEELINDVRKELKNITTDDEVLDLNIRKNKVNKHIEDLNIIDKADYEVNKTTYINHLKNIQVY